MMCYDMSMKNKLGRPLKFETVEEMQKAIDLFFQSCDPHVIEVLKIVTDPKTKLKKQIMEKEISEQRPYTISGLALALGIHRDTLLEYESRDAYSDAIKTAKNRVHAYVEARLFTNNPVGSIFNLKNNFGWKDQTLTDITSKGEKLEAVHIFKPEKNPD